jgi:hypothetical protein
LLLFIKEKKDKKIAFHPISLSFHKPHTLCAFHQGKEEIIYAISVFSPRHSQQTRERLTSTIRAPVPIKCREKYSIVRGGKPCSPGGIKNPPPSLTTSNEGRGLRRGYSILIIPAFSHLPRKI